MNNQLNLEKVTIGSQLFYQLDDFTQLALIKASRNEILLSEVIWSNRKNLTICRAAMENIEDAEKLYDIACEHSNHLVRRAAAERIVDNDKLKVILKTEEEWSVRYEALKNVSDKEILEWVKNNDDNDNVRSLARAKLLAML